MSSPEIALDPVDDGAELRAIRVSRRVRSEDLVKHLTDVGITRRVLYKIESGERVASADERHLIIAAIRVLSQ